MVYQGLIKNALALITSASDLQGIFVFDVILVKYKSRRLRLDKRQSLILGEVSITFQEHPLFALP